MCFKHLDQVCLICGYRDGQHYEYSLCPSNDPQAPSKNKPGTTFEPSGRFKTSRQVAGDITIVRKLTYTGTKDLLKNELKKSYPIGTRNIVNSAIKLTIESLPSSISEQELTAPEPEPTSGPKPKMTIKEMYRAHKKIWKQIVLDPEISKAAAISRAGFASGQFTNNCPACEYVEQHYGTRPEFGLDCGNQCPLRWHPSDIVINGRQTCLSSCYDEWTKTKTYALALAVYDTPLKKYRKELL